jgi:hypothetical protein
VIFQDILVYYKRVYPLTLGTVSEDTPSCFRGVINGETGKAATLPDTLALPCVKNFRDYTLVFALIFVEKPDDRAVK